MTHRHLPQLIRSVLESYPIDWSHGIVERAWRDPRILLAVISGFFPVGVGDGGRLRRNNSMDSFEGFWRDSWIPAIQQ